MRREITAVPTAETHDWMPVKLLILFLRYKWCSQRQSKEIKHIVPLLTFGMD